MRISELSARSGVSIASIKYYLREGLLPPGRSVGTNQADYDEAHLRRLNLIRALIDVGELSISSTGNVLRAVDSDTVALHDAFGAVMHALDPDPPDVERGTLDAVHRWLRRRRWEVDPDAPAIRTLAGLIATLQRFGFPTTLNEFDAYADHVMESSEVGVAWARAAPDRTRAVETMVVGTLVYERALAEVRRLALEAASSTAERRAAATRSRGRARTAATHRAARR